MKPFVYRSFWLAPLALLATSTALAQNPPPGAAPGNPPPRGEQGQPPAQARPPDGPPPGQANYPQLPTVPVHSLIERVARSSKKSFLVDPRVRAQVYLGTLREEDVTYPVLLSILRLYGYATFTLEGHVNIVPDAVIRQSPVPIVQNDDRNLAADEWITRIITTSKANAATLVPILRPMLPQAAHLAAQCVDPDISRNAGAASDAADRGGCHRLIVMDTYANVQRINALVKSLDQ